MPIARNTRTGQTVKQQDLTGRRYALHEAALARLASEELARNMNLRGQDLWRASVRPYEVD